VAAGETVGVVGESGCGKSTTAKLVLRLLERDGGDISFAGQNLGAIHGSTLRALRARLQVVPQNPQTSLNPRLRAGESVAFNLRAHGVPRNARPARVAELLDKVGLAPSYADRYPHELSGGQLQRVAIARALATDPSLVVCDEAVSALDKSIQAQILNLLGDLRDELGVAYLFISHDLAVVEHLSDRVVVMYLGRIVEEGTAEALYQSPQHPYTRALLSAVPGLGRERIMLRGDPPSPTSPPSGCRFRTRCPEAVDVCAEAEPPLVDIGLGHRVACVHVRPPALAALVAPAAPTPPAAAEPAPPSAAPFTTTGPEAGLDPPGRQL
jgi:peptide/nickel transport system ATP-binding protein/oligopeptide transport system ATP-binding protein